MLNKEQWKERENELEELIKQREELSNQIEELSKQRTEKIKQREKTSKKIHRLQIYIRQHEAHKERKIQTDTEVYRMFGKPLKELTKEEYKVYYNARQRINRQKRKEQKEKNK